MFCNLKPSTHWNIKKNPCNLCGCRGSHLVEVGGVEPPSESTLTELSPGAGGYCGSLPSCSLSRRQAATPPGQVRVMMRGQVNSFPPHGRHINDAFPGLWPLRFRRLPLVRQQQQQCCCYLIYNLPVLWMSGASARWSRLHTPVETGTPPHRSKRRCSPPDSLEAHTDSFVSPLSSAAAALVSAWPLKRIPDGRKTVLAGISAG